MFAVHAARESRRIPVLLGGSGLAGRLLATPRKIPALLRPLPCSGTCVGRRCDECSVAG